LFPFLAVLSKFLKKKGGQDQDTIESSRPDSNLEKKILGGGGGKGRLNLISLLIDLNHPGGGGKGPLWKRHQSTLALEEGD